MGSWWARGLLVTIIAIFIYGMTSAFLGFYVPPLTKEGKHLRRGAKHATHYHGYYFGGGTRAGK